MILFGSVMLDMLLQLQNAPYDKSPPPIVTLFRDVGIETVNKSYGLNRCSIFTMPLIVPEPKMYPRGNNHEGDLPVNGNVIFFNPLQ